MDYSKNTTIKIKGGLGNQLFQYSFAIFLEQNFNKTVTLDLSWFDQQSLRRFQLPEFLNEPILTTKIFKKNFCQKLLSYRSCLLYTSPSPRDRTRSRMPSSA